MIQSTGPAGRAVINGLVNATTVSGSVNTQVYIAVSVGAGGTETLNLPEDGVLYSGRNGVGKQEVPPGYDETRPVGRPKEKSSIVGTQKDPLGKDRLGSKENGQIYTANSPEESGTPKGGSPLALAEFRKNMSIFKDIPFKKTEQGFSLLNEENIKGIE